MTAEYPGAYDWDEPENNVKSEGQTLEESMGDFADYDRDED